jgi:heme/copper-type cytochrome/quinol oxidase subunit 2
MSKFYKLLAISLFGFAGGVIAVLFMNWLSPMNIKVGSTSDAISVANTYIVFTTIIFVGFTVVLGVAGYVFAQQFSASTESHENRLIDDLKAKLKDNEMLSLELIKAILENEAVKSHLTVTLESKVSQVVTDKLTELELTAGSDFNEMSVSIDGGNANE